MDKNKIEEITKNLNIPKTKPINQIRKLKKVGCIVLDIQKINKDIFYIVATGLKTEGSEVKTMYVHQKMVSSITSTFEDTVLYFYCSLINFMDYENYKVVLPDVIVNYINSTSKINCSVSFVKNILRTLTLCDYLKYDKNKGYKLVPYTEWIQTYED